MSLQSRRKMLMANLKRGSVAPKYLTPPTFDSSSSSSSSMDLLKSHSVIRLMLMNNDQAHAYAHARAHTGGHGHANGRGTGGSDTDNSASTDADSDSAISDNDSDGESNATRPSTRRRKKTKNARASDKSRHQRNSKGKTRRAQKKIKTQGSGGKKDSHGPGTGKHLNGIDVSYHEGVDDDIAAFIEGHAAHPSSEYIQAHTHESSSGPSSYTMQGVSALALPSASSVSPPNSLSVDAAITATSRLQAGGGSRLHMRSSSFFVPTISSLKHAIKPKSEGSSLLVSASTPVHRLPPFACRGTCVYTTALDTLTPWLGPTHEVHERQSAYC